MLKIHRRGGGGGGGYVHVVKTSWGTMSTLQIICRGIMSTYTKMSREEGVSAGMTLDKCIVLQIGMLTGCPLCRESHPMCRLKNPTVI